MVRLTPEHSTLLSDLMMTEANPLLAPTDLPEYAAIRPEHVVPAVTSAVAAHCRSDARAARRWLGTRRCLWPRIRLMWR